MAQIHPPTARPPAPPQMIDDPRRAYRDAVKELLKQGLFHHVPYRFLTI
jgi:hypothetical protein